MLRFFLILVLTGASAAATAAEVVLREQATLAGSIVRLGDVATVSADDALLSEHLSSTPLMPAPSQGTQHFLRMSELRDLLAARGVDVRQLKFAGAEVVVIAAGTGPAIHLAQAEPTTGPAEAAGDATGFATPEELTAAIVAYLQRQTGHQLWKVRVDADSDVMAAFEASGARGISGGAAPWSGRQRFSISNGPKAKGVFAYARVDRQESIAVLVRGVAAGELIRRSDVAVEPYTGALPKQTVTSPDELIGREAVQAIRPGSLVLSNQVRSPLMVRRGDRVSVRARAAGVSVRTYAIAQQDGSLGELVTVQSGDSKDRFAARVSGLRELEILAAGSSAVEVAAAPTTELR